MPIVVDEGSGGGGNYTPHPEGSFGAVCVDVYDEGMVEETWEGVTKSKHKLRIYFFCGEYVEKGDGTFPLLASKRFTATLHENGALRPWLEAWRGKKFTPEELKGFDVESLIGAPALIQVSHAVKGDKTYANIDFAGRLPKGMTAPKAPADFERRKDRDAKKEAEKTPVGAPKGPFDDPDSDLPF